MATSLHSTLVLEMIRIVWKTQIVCSSSFVVKACPSGSAGVEECSSLDSGAGGTAPASVDCSSCWWTLQSCLSLRSLALPVLLVDPPPPFPHPSHLSHLSLSAPPHVDRSQCLLAVRRGGVRWCVCLFLSDLAPEWRRGS